MVIFTLIDTKSELHAQSRIQTFEDIAQVARTEVERSAAVRIRSVEVSASFFEGYRHFIVVALAGIVESSVAPLAHQVGLEKGQPPRHAITFA
jgi:hypothetical protein